jgi:hypothetical protein
MPDRSIKAEYGAPTALTSKPSRVTRKGRGSAFWSEESYSQPWLSEVACGVAEAGSAIQ